MFKEAPKDYSRPLFCFTLASGLSVVTAGGLLHIILLLLLLLYLCLSVIGVTVSVALSLIPW